MKQGVRQLAVSVRTNGRAHTVLQNRRFESRIFAARLHSSSAVQRLGHDVPDPFCICFTGPHSRPRGFFPRISDLTLLTGIVEVSHPMLSALCTKISVEEILDRTNKTTVSMLDDM
jgi:hypothetical protein